MEKVFCSIQGSGQPLVLIHGFCEDSRIWAKIAPALAANHKLVLVDLPGFGQSPLATQETIESVEGMADRVAFTLKSEGLTGCVVLGHSLGGYVTLALAQRHPDLLQAFGLFHSTAYPDTDEKKEARVKQADFVKSNGVAPFVKTLIPTLFAQKFPHEEILTQAMEIAKQCSAEGIINALLAMRQRPERLEVLKNAQIPVLIIAGAEDGVVPPEKLSYQASLPARCQFELFNRSGHMGQLEEPEMSIQAIQSFVGFVNRN